MLAMSADYRDVFIPTSQLYVESNIAGSVGIGLGLLSVGLAIWLASDLPGISMSIGKKTYKRLMITFTWVLFSFIAVMLVSLGTGLVKYIEYYNKVEIVKNNMKHNIQEKYGASLQGWGETNTAPAIPEPLDEPHNFTLSFSPEDAINPVMKTYSIRFDPETNEPYVAETGDTVAPTAAELEASAKK